MPKKKKKPAHGGGGRNQGRKSCAELGIKPRVKTSIQLKAALLEQIDREREKHGWSRSRMIEYLCMKALGRGIVDVDEISERGAE